MKRFQLLSIVLLSVFLFMGCRSLPRGIRVEHVALDVTEPEATARWWCDNLGFSIAARLPVAPFAIFIVDNSGQFAVELYRATDSDAAPDYHHQSPQRVHIAFMSDDISHDIQRLTAAGAQLVSHDKLPGNELVMLRDPSGIPIQLVKRGKPVLRLP